MTRQDRIGKRNLAIVVLVALVGVVSIVALVVNSSALSHLSFGGKLALGAEDNLVGNAAAAYQVRCGSWIGEYKIIAIGTIWNQIDYQKSVVAMKNGEPPSVWLGVGDEIPETGLRIRGIRDHGTYCSTDPWYPPKDNPKVTAWLSFDYDDRPKLSSGRG